MKKENQKNKKRRTSKLILCICILVVIVFMFIFMVYYHRRVDSLPEDVRIRLKSSGILLPSNPNISEIKNAIAFNSKEKSGTAYRTIEATGDFDGDGKDDTISGTDFRFIINLSQNGRKYIHSTWSGESSVGIHDIDNDSHPDAWCYDGGDNVIFIIWGDGKGYFSGKQILAGLPNDQKCSFFDVDNDGDLDLVFQQDDNGIGWMELSPASPK